ncbi:MAG: type II toxin-antitoxin system PemK/MazF family toxin [Gaiellaceae bacterium]
MDSSRSHEQAGRRPALIVSSDVFNHWPAGLVVLIPMTKPASSRQVR